MVSGPSMGVGRTIPTYRLHLESILNDWMDYRRALREKRSEEHTSELQSRGHLVHLPSFPTRRSSDLGFISGSWAIDLFLNRVTLRHFRPSLPRSRSYGLRPFDGRGPHDPDVPPPSGVDPERLDGLPAGLAGE